MIGTNAFHAGLAAATVAVYQTADRTTAGIWLQLSEATQETLVFPGLHSYPVTAGLSVESLVSAISVM